VVAALLSSVLGTLFTLAVRRHRIARPTSSLHAAIRLSGHVVMTRLSWYLYANSDFAVAGRVLGQTALGNYTLAWTLTNLPIEKITALATSVSPAYLSAVQKDLAALRRYLLAPTAVIAFIAFPVLVGMSMTARDAIAVVLGHKWDAAVPPLQILAAYACVRSIAPLLPPVLVVTGESAFLMWNTIAYAVVMPTSFYIGSWWGLNGIAFAWVLAYPIVTVPMYMRLFRTIELPAREYMSTLAPAAVATTAMAGVLFGINLTGAAHLAPALRLTADVICGAAVYAAVLWTCFRERLDTYRRYVSRRSQES